jgi:hypothetical protein
MTPQFTREEFKALGAPDLVYVREIKAKEILAGATVDSVEGIPIDPDQTLYAVHSAAGERLAVLIDKKSAFAAAAAHELAPVSVH